MKQERVAKARRKPDCMAGRDFRDQNEAKKCEKTGFRKADREVVNSSLVGGKAYAEAASRRVAECRPNSGGRVRRRWPKTGIFGEKQGPAY